MTLVGFYVVQSTQPGDRMRVAARLADKAFSRGHKIFINASDETEAKQLDELLWSFRASSFLPHGLFGQEHAETIGIGWGQDPDQHNDRPNRSQHHNSTTLGDPPSTARPSHQN